MVRGKEVPQILMNPNLDTNTPPLSPRVMGIPLQTHRPPVPPEVLPRRDDHVAHELALLHERGAERLGARPGLRAAAVEVDARGEGGDEGRGARELERDVGAELDDGRGLLRGGDGEVGVARELVAVELFGEDHGRPAEVGAVFVDGFAEGELGGGGVRGWCLGVWVRGACLAVSNHGGAGVEEAILAFS